MTVAGPATPDAAAAGRQCARCRHTFPIEEGTHPMELLGWWTCQECTEALLPGRHRTTTANAATTAAKSTGTTADPGPAEQS